MRVLVIEDDTAIRTLVHDILSDEGHTVIVSSGSESIAELVRASAPDVIILDLKLADTTGEYLLHQLSSDEERRQIPVIVSSVWRTRMGALRQQAAAYNGPLVFLPKPYGVADLLASVRQVEVMLGRS